MKKSHLKHIIKEIIKEEIDGPGIFVPHDLEGRKDKKKQLDYRKIQDYIKNGSKGNLDLENSQITELPDNLKVGGYLYLENTQITELPDNLTVGGYIELRDTPITKLPNNLTVDGVIYLDGTPLSKKYSKEEIKDIIERQGGNVGEGIFV